MKPQVFNIKAYMHGAKTAFLNAGIPASTKHKTEILIKFKLLSLQIHDKYLRTKKRKLVDFQAATQTFLHSLE